MNKKADLEEIRLMRTLLQKARVRIKSRNSRFICNAIGETFIRGDGRLQHPAEVKALDRLLEWIGHQLQGCSFYENWVLAIAGELPSREQMRKARLRWIDHMISVLDEMEKEL